jgi:hypothetical protein
MLRLLEILSQFSRDDLTYTSATIMVLSMLVGHTADVALGDRGFGSYGNTLVILGTSFATIAFFLINSGQIRESDVTRLSFYCLALSITAIVSLGILKSRFMRG